MAAPDYNAIYQQALSQQQQAAAPAISALQATQPSLEARYKSILDQLAGREKTEIGQTQTLTSQEFGKRGVPLSSGVFGQTLNQKIQPISQYYTGQMGQTQADRESAIAQLAAQVAEMQSGVGQNAVQQALSMYGQQQSAYQAELDRANQLKAAQASAATPTFATQAAPAAATVPSNRGVPSDPTNTAGNLLTQVISGNRDIYIDKNEAKQAYDIMLRSGFTDQQAWNAINSALAKFNLKKYQW